MKRITFWSAIVVLALATFTFVSCSSDNGSGGAPRRPWTIAELAVCSGLSRAVFAEKFTAAVGQPPIAYLTNWRLINARRLLRESDLGTDEIARRCGYQSLPSFSRRFKAVFRVGPGAYRRTAVRR